MKKTLLILVTAICSFNCFAQLPSWLPSNGLIAWYPFHGNANDESGNGNNGTINGAMPTANRFGNPSSAYQFNGTSNFITLPSSVNQLITSSYTISFWIYATSNTNKLDGYEIIGDRIASTWNYRYRAVFSGSNAGSPPDTLFLTACYGGPTKSILSPSPNINTWYHYVMVYDGITTFKGYINGVLIDSVTGISSLTSGNRKINIARCVSPAYPTGGAYYKGLIDDIGFWNRALNISEVNQLYLSCNASPTATISSFGNTSFCAGSDVLLIASPNSYVNYQWKKNATAILGATNSSYNANTTGDYSCFITNGCGTATSSIIHATKLPLASVSISNTDSLNICPGSSATLTATNPGVGYTYQWYRNNVTILGATGLSYTTYNAGTYKIIITNTANGCARNSGTKKVVVVACKNGIAQTSQDLTPNNINVYPNPVSNSFTFELNEDVKGVATISLLNTLGQTVFESKSEVENGQPIENLFINGKLKAGLYILRIAVNDKMFVSKVIIN